MITAVLVRWARGWIERENTDGISAHGRQEALLSLGALEDNVQIQQAADFQLLVYARPRTEIRASIKADTGNVPLVDFIPGEGITVPDIDGTPAVETVLAVTYTEDDNGQATAAVEIKDKLEIAQERIEASIAKAHDGSFVGRSAVATRPQYDPRTDWTGVATRQQTIPFSGDESTVTTGTNTGFGHPRQRGNMQRARLDIETDIANDLSVDVFYGATNIGTITIAAGDTHGELDGAGMAAFTDTPFFMTCTDDGGGGFGRITGYVDLI